MKADYGKLLMIAGAVLLVTGIIVYFWGDRLSWIGNLPGDIRIKNGKFSFYFPVMTMILFSVLISLLIRLFRHFF